MSDSVFWPRDGAVLDLDSLQALAEEGERSINAAFGLRWPEATSVVLTGLELIGNPSAADGHPPGTVERGPELRFADGSAVVKLDGRRRVVKLPSQTRPWQNLPNWQGMLVGFNFSLEDERIDAQLLAARRGLQSKFFAVGPGKPLPETFVPIAVALDAAGMYWCNDVRRVAGPAHDLTRSLVRRLDAALTQVWQHQPQGPVFVSRTFGDNTLYYQCSAAAALQGARALLSTSALTSPERAQLVEATLESLRNLLGQQPSRPNTLSAWQVLARAAGPAINPATPWGALAARLESR